MRILIVEDEVLINEDISMILRQEGYTVAGQAYDGATAMDKINTQMPDLVLLDIHLNHALNGFEIAEVLNKKYKIPFVFITSYSDKSTLESAKSLLPLGYIVKPFKKKDIIALMNIISFRIMQSPPTLYFSHDEINKLAVEALTTKEYELLKDLADGLHNEEIASKHFIALNTVKTHLKNIYSKLEVNSRSQATSKLLRKQ